MHGDDLDDLLYELGLDAPNFQPVGIDEQGKLDEKAKTSRVRSVVMSSKPKLHIDWCSHEAAKFAVMNWHYSKQEAQKPNWLNSACGKMGNLWGLLSLAMGPREILGNRTD